MKNKAFNEDIEVKSSNIHFATERASCRYCVKAYSRGGEAELTFDFYILY